MTVVGNGNVVNTNFTDLSHVLNGLRSAILSSPVIDDQAKLNAAADLDTLQAQLQKPEPDKSIVQRAWQGIQVAATAGELVELSFKIAALTNRC